MSEKIVVERIPLGMNIFGEDLSTEVTALMFQKRLHYLWGRICSLKEVQGIFFERFYSISDYSALTKFIVKKDRIASMKSLFCIFLLLNSYEKLNFLNELT